MRTSLHLQFLSAAVLTVAFAGPAPAQKAANTPVSVVLVHGAFENSQLASKRESRTSSPVMRSCSQSRRRWPT
jgi:hypothetical protein